MEDNLWWKMTYMMEDNLKNEDDLKNEDNIKNKDNIKNEDNLNKLALTPKIIFLQCFFYMVIDAPL